MAVEKLSISLPADLAREVREFAADEGVSAFTAKSLRLRIEQEKRRKLAQEYLAEADELYGPLSEEAIKEAHFRDRDVFVFRDRKGKVMILHRTRDGKMELIEAP